MIQPDLKMQGNTCYIHLAFRTTDNTDTRNAVGMRLFKQSQSKVKYIHFESHTKTPIT